MATNDTFDLTSKLIKGTTEKENAARRNDLKLFQEQPLMYSISPLYARYIGETVNVAYNGNFRKFPVNGEQFPITRGHYNAMTKYLRSIDKQIRIAKTNAKFMDQNATGDFKKIV